MKILINMINDGEMVNEAVINDSSDKCRTLKVPIYFRFIVIFRTFVKWSCFMEHNPSYQICTLS